VTFEIPAIEGKALALAYQMGEVLQRELDEETGATRLTIRLQAETYAKLGQALKVFEV
jgi:hypothetical protein